MRYHRLRGRGSTVVTMTSKVNGTMEISTPCRSETLEDIETKIGKNDYAMVDLEIDRVERIDSTENRPTRL